MNLKIALSALCAILMTCTQVNAIFFHIKETEQKCFIEELPEDTLFVAKYKVQMQDPSSEDKFLPTTPGIGMNVEVKDPEDKMILSKMYGAEGRFSFTSQTPGEHTICVRSNSSAWFGGANMRVHLSFEIGEHAVDYGEVATKEKLTELQLRVRQLLDQVEQISKEQNYQRVSWEDFGLF